YEAGLGWELPNLVSSIFGFVMAAGIAMVVVDLATHARVGRRAPRNPWGADTLEWACAMPPAPYNFASQARIEARHPLWEQPRLPESIERGMHA
ncbi:hypothetical protein OFM39_28190, partial [Escherichia coli]|nr:hypothetical protein [Escherichia coli]